MTANADKASETFKKCQLSASQTEEIFSRWPLEKRHGLNDWGTNAAKACSFFKLSSTSGAAGRPECWMIKTLDTGRFCKLKWHAVRFTRIPAAAEHKSLFVDAMRVLEPLAVPITVWLSRYERLPESGAAVIGVDAPLASLSALIESNVEQDGLVQSEDVDAEEREKQQLACASKARKLWVEAGGSLEHFRETSLTLFQLRQSSLLPFVVLCSLQEKKGLVVWFRDYNTLDSTFNGGVRHLTRENPGRSGMSELAEKELSEEAWPFVEWKLLEYSKDLDRPAVYCQNPGCPKCNEGMAKCSDEKLLSHSGPRDKDLERPLVAAMKQLWKEKYAALLNAEIEERTKMEIEAKGLEGEEKKAAEAAIQDETVEKYDGMCAAEEKEQLARVKAEMHAAKLRRCSACKAVLYCSAACVKEDWPRHKTFCKKVAAKKTT